MRFAVNVGVSEAFENNGEKLEVVRVMYPYSAWRTVNGAGSLDGPYGCTVA